MGQGSEGLGGHTRQDAVHGNPNRRQEVKIEIEQANMILKAIPFLPQMKKKYFQDFREGWGGN